MRDFPAVELTWRDGLFAHWSLDPSRVRPLIPDALDLDCREGSAWVSALPSVVEATRPCAFPRMAGLSFRQVNLRTYVRYEGRPGVYFLSLDTSSGLGVRVARSFYGLPYYRADIEFERGDAFEGSTDVDAPTLDSPHLDSPDSDGPTCRFVSQRQRRRDRSRDDAPTTRFAATYRPTGRPTRAAPDSLDEFLAERYRLFVTRGRSVWSARVEHAPWRLCPAEASVQADSLLEAAGLPVPTEDPVVRYSPASQFTIRTPVRP